MKQYIENNIGLDMWYLDNGWTIEVSGQISNFTDDQIKYIHKTLLRSTVVIMKDQNLTPEEELRIVKIIGNPISTIKDKRVDDTTILPGIIRVTGKKNKDGIIGLFGHTSTLDWHANRCSSPERKPIIWMWGETGMVNSKTSFINNIVTYNDLPQTLKDKIANKKVFCGYRKSTYSESSQFKEHINRDWGIPLVYTNDGDQTGLYFPYHQILEMENTPQEECDALIEELRQHVVQEKYIYHHEWQNHDLLLSEQWLSIHKRWQFDQMEDRLLHRIAYDYSNL